MDVKNAEKNPYPHRWSADKFLLIDLGDIGYFAVGWTSQDIFLCWYHPLWVAEER